MSIKDKLDKLYTEREELIEKLNTIDSKIFNLEIECEHNRMVDDTGTGVCPDCRLKTEGWFCKTSPTKECEYYDETSDTYDEDCCIYCGNPEERK